MGESALAMCLRLCARRTDQSLLRSGTKERHVGSYWDLSGPAERLLSRPSFTSYDEGRVHRGKY
ncbi:hypothetical protein FA13DRAFT_1726540 [Coprinellus micaceus]|uniref:Uncharacterized protein n=1 Tax=Coprinellus micaceus TaxID=71717 RepID=A0A4Y7TV12_COPMI|nr:hypothetical protein FA13DRAFT_1726540 [Coprinellus micaceus]